MDKPFKYRLTIAYDGTRYSGWQIQPNSNSIQEMIEKALQTLFKRPIRLIAAGRTDAGVHALGQVAHFCLDLPFSCDRLSYALNGMLPHDIRIKECREAEPSFHAQYSALSKEYHYHLWLEKTVDPFYRLYRHHVCDSKFSFSQLQEALPYFIGTHDFATFANVGGSVATTVRTLTRIELCPQEGGVRLEFEGEGFLYKMVRNIVGTLLEVATGRRRVEEIPHLFAAQDRRQAGPAAPPLGLFLAKVNYPSISLNEEKWANSLPVSLES